MSAGKKAFQLAVDHDLVEAHLVVVDSTRPESFLSLEAAEKALAEKGIVYGIDRDALQAACNRLGEAKVGERFLVAKAKEPTRGEDARIEFHVDVSGKAVYEAGDGGEKSVDFKKATSVVSVKEGELIATVHPPKPGLPGKLLTGAEVPPPKVKPAQIRAGTNVECDEAGTTFTATAEGRPLFQEQVLSVVPVYEINGDVGYKTGHVNFRGTVHVTGNIQDEFNVHAKTLTVNGTLGASEIVCEGDVTINGGVAGHDKAKIIAGGSVQVKYINNATVECIGDLVVRREIVNSQVMANGVVKASSIIGGKVSARCGVLCKVLGSELGIATRIEPGVDLQIRKIDTSLAEIDARIEDLLRPVQIYFGERSRYRALPAEKKQEFRESFEEFKRLFAAHFKLAKRRASLADDESAKCKCHVVVLKMLHADTVIASEDCMRSFTKQATGPVEIEEDLNNSTMTLKSYTGDPEAFGEEDNDPTHTTPAGGSA